MNTASPTFVADQPGIYVAQLIVNDGLSSTPSTTNVTASGAKPNPGSAAGAISLALQSNSVAKPGKITGFVSLPSPATVAVPVDLSINPADCTVDRSTLSIPAGSQQASFTIDAPATAQAGAKILTVASAGNSQTANFDVA